MNQKSIEMNEDLIYQDFEYADNFKLGKLTGRKIIIAMKDRKIDEIKKLINLPVEKGGLILLRLIEKDVSGKTAKDYAIESGENEIIELFK